LYFLFITFTKVWYGDIMPNEEPRMIGVIEAMVGYLSLAALISIFRATGGPIYEQR
jgi:hypothetical protein